MPPSAPLIVAPTGHLSLHSAPRQSGTVATMDYVPLLFLGLVVVGGAIVLRSLIRLKKAAVEALEAARELESSLESLRKHAPGGEAAPPG